MLRVHTRLGYDVLDPVESNISTATFFFFFKKGKFSFYRKLTADFTVLLLLVLDVLADTSTMQ